MAYVDGFVLAVPKDKVEDYKRIVADVEPLFREFGAIAYVECIGDDVPHGVLTSFPRAVMAREDEVVAFSWAVYPSRQVRDEAQKKMMSDPRMAKVVEHMPVDGKRMIFGGFQPFIGL